MRCFRRIEPGSAADSPCSEQLRRQDLERGNAVIEFVFLAVMLMVPTIYALIAVAHVQAGAYASVAAGQQALQVLEERGLEEVSAGTAQNAAAYAAADYGIAPDQVSTVLSCTGDCTAGNHLSITVNITVQAPLLGWIGDGGVLTLSTSLSSWGGRYE